MKISLEAIRVLDAIERRGSFAAAAGELHRVTSALSYKVAKLEHELGFALFRKQGKRSVLTEAGRTLLHDGRKLLRAAEQIEQRAHRVALGWEAELRLSLDTLLPMSAITALVRRFDALQCGTELGIREEVLAGSWDALLSGRSDLAIGASGDMPAGGGISTRPLLELEMVMVAASDHPLAKSGAALSEAELAEHRIVVIADSSRDLPRRSSNILGSQQRITVPDLAAKLRCHLDGLGIGAIPRHVAEYYRRSGELAILDTGRSIERVRMQLAWRSEDNGRALNWFIDEILDSAPDWYALA